MRQKVFFFFLTISIFIKSNYASVAEHTNVHPTGQVGLIENYSANTLGFTKLLFSVSGDFAYDSHLVPQMIKQDGYLQDGIFSYDTLSPFAVLYGIYPSLAFGITDFLDISISQPVFFDVLEGSLPRDALVADIIYTPLETPFLGAARERQNRTLNGLGMLIHQGPPAWKLWFGLEPTVTDELRRIIERSIAGE